MGLHGAELASLSSLPCLEELLLQTQAFHMLFNDTEGHSSPTCWPYPSPCPTLQVSSLLVLSSLFLPSLCILSLTSSWLGVPSGMHGWITRPCLGLSRIWL